MKLLLAALGCHVLAVLAALASSGLSPGEDSPVPVGVVVPWVSALAGCALVVLGGAAARQTPVRIASALQGVGLAAWAAITRAPIEAGPWATTACVATILGSTLAALRQRGS
ncbi:MAG: hypothetical protein JNJ54_26415 [Myxococcaceae bacterium]|nr:hypothetical protein [Myxococcaceae bacterium]